MNIEIGKYYKVFKLNETYLIKVLEKNQYLKVYFLHMEQKRLKKSSSFSYPEGCPLYEWKEASDVESRYLERCMKKGYFVEQPVPINNVIKELEDYERTRTPN